MFINKTINVNSTHSHKLALSTYQNTTHYTHVD